jgi:riboflavin kinase/FMN adenylyltransferase
MKIIRDINLPRLSSQGCVATMGNFDGIHIGHQTLLKNVVDEARRLERPSLVLTFDPHPLKVLAPQRAPKLLLTHDDKMQLLQSFGIDIVVVQKFDAQLAKIEAEEFVRRYLVERLQIQKIWVGKDLRFGHKRGGAVSDLLRWGAELGFDVGTVEPILDKNVRASSSRVRELLHEGRVAEAEPILGRYHFVSGTVIRGSRPVLELGSPMANIVLSTEAVPAAGTYATLCMLDSTQWPSVSKIDLDPISGYSSPSVESFLFHFTRNIYEEPVKLTFVRRIPEEMEFSSIQQLVTELAKDVQFAKNIFPHSNHRSSPSIIGR